MSKIIHFHAILQCSEGVGAHHFVEVPTEIAHQLTEKSKVRVICGIHDRYEFQCALMPRKGQFFIGMGKKIIKAAKIEKGELLDLTLQKDDSKYGLILPEALQTIFDQDTLVNKRFHELTPGKQRSVIHYISKAKRLDTQTKRAMSIAENIRLGAKTLEELFGK